MAFEIRTGELTSIWLPMLRVISKFFSIFAGFFSTISGKKSCAFLFGKLRRARHGPLWKLRRPLSHMISAVHMLQPHSKTDLLPLEHGIATGPVNHATFHWAGPRAGILKLEDCTVPHMTVLILCFVFRLFASSIRESSCVSVRTIQHRQAQ